MTRAEGISMLSQPSRDHKPTPKKLSILDTPASFWLPVFAAMFFFYKKERNNSCYFFSIITIYDVFKCFIQDRVL